MTDINCKYDGDREGMLIAYLYDDIDAGDRAAFDAHLAACARCRTELSALGGVRQQLKRWEPPINPQFAIRHPQSSSWRQIPTWAQVAAALLFLGVSAGVANLNVKYDASGLTVRTGWMNVDSAQLKPGAPDGDQARLKPGTSATVASQSDLTALEQRLRDELRAAPAANAAPRPSTADADTLRRVRALIDESERRQQRELALRVAQVLTDVQAQRQADLRKIDTTLSGVQRDLGIQVLQQRERMNYLMRVNQRQ